MRLTVVGCSGSFPGPDSPASCYLVEADHSGRTFRLLLDLGNGALGALQRHAALESIDVVVLSHLHPDHCLDLCSFYVVRKYDPGGPMSRLLVYGPEGTAERMGRAYAVSSSADLDDEFDFRVFPAEPFALGPFSVEVARVDHPVQAYAIRVSDGDSSLVYTGDTALCGPVEQLAKGADVLLAEASFLESAPNPRHLHMTGKDAACLAQRAGVGRLVLTHIPPWHSPDDVLEEATPHFTGPAMVATQGLQLTI
jgi:ribonuclease BN (tRNA processing enzyme)